MDYPSGGFGSMRYLRRAGEPAGYRIVQRTVADQIIFTGIGIHSGKPAVLSIGPGDPDSGYVFLRSGDDIAGDIEIRVGPGTLDGTQLCTAIGNGNGVRISTVEHLLSALSGLGIDNALITIDGPEVPAMDGSAEAFVDAIMQVGLREQAAARRFIRVTKPIRLQREDCFAEFHPHEGRRFEISIDYACDVIGRQEIAIDLDAARYRTDICRARTYGHMHDVERLWAAGLALGASLDNSVVVGDGKVVNAEGLRFADEFVRHKLLDAIGDLALAGLPILGLYRSYRGGHRLNADAVRALLADRTAHEVVTAPDHADSSASRAARRELVREGHAEPALGLAAPAFAPERS